MLGAEEGSHGRCPGTVVGTIEKRNKMVDLGRHVVVVGKTNKNIVSLSYLFIVARK